MHNFLDKFNGLLSVAAMILALLNLVEWQYCHKEYSYYNGRQRNGWWALFWLAICIWLLWFYR